MIYARELFQRDVVVGFMHTTMFPLEFRHRTRHVLKCCKCFSSEIRAGVRG